VPFKKGNTLRKKGVSGRQAGSENKMTREVKEILVKMFGEGLGGYEGFLKWVKSDPENLSAFYTRLWIKMLPMHVNVEAREKIVYRSYQELSVAYASFDV